MSQPFVSICIPAYNQDKYLRKCLDSICIQKYKDFEVIVSDDSSNGLVETLVAEYKSKLPIIFNRNTPALGSPKNWNCCLDLAAGEWIKFMHHDDWFSSPDSLQKFVNAATQLKHEFIFCDSEILNVENNTISINRPSNGFLIDFNRNVELLFGWNGIGAPSAVMFKRNELRFDEKISYTVDIDFYLRYLQVCKTYTYIPTALIVNTSNNVNQVTAASLNLQTQVGEYSYLYNKLFTGKIPNQRQSDLFRSIFKKYKITSQAQIQELIGEKLRPTWYFNFLIFLSRIR